MKAKTLLSALLLLAATGCGASTLTLPPARDGATFRIVSSFPTKGQSARQSKLMREAIDLAVQRHNDKHTGWNGEQVALDGGSDETGEWSARVEEANAQAAAADPNVIAYIGPYNSGAAMYSMPILNSAGLLQMLPSATWPGLTEGGWEPDQPLRFMPTHLQTAVRAMPSDGEEAKAAADWASETGAKAVFLIGDGSSYSQGMLTVFKQYAEGKGSLHVTDEADAGSMGANQLHAAAAAGAVFFAPSNLEEAEHVAQLLDALQPRPQVFATEVVLSDQLPQTSREQMRGWHVLYNGSDTFLATEQGRQFASDFTRLYGAGEQPTQFAANAYDLANLALDAAETVGRDRKAILSRVLATQHYAGVSGDVTFLPNGDRAGGAISRYEVANGVFVQLTPGVNPR